MVTWGSPQNWKNKESINPNGCWIRLVPCRNHMFISTSIVVYPAISSTSHRKATSHQARPPNGLLEEIAKIFLAIFSSAANVTMAIFSWSIFILDRWVWLMKFRWLMADFEVWNNCRVCRVWVSEFREPRFGDSFGYESAKSERHSTIEGQIGARFKWDLEISQNGNRREDHWSAVSIIIDWGTVYERLHHWFLNKAAGFSIANPGPSHLSEVRWPYSTLFKMEMRHMKNGNKCSLFWTNSFGGFHK